MKRLLLLLLLALPLLADEPITVIPPGPSTATPVILRLDVWCSPITGHAFLAAAGTTIRIQLTAQQGTCPSPPFGLPYEVNLGRLPSGEWNVEVYVNNSVFKRTFIVRNAGAGLLDVHPFAVPTAPNGLRLRLTAPAGCAGENCGGVTVKVGGLPIPPENLRASNDGSISFNAPPRAKGFADVSAPPEASNSALAQKMDGSPNTEPAQPKSTGPTTRVR